ncbi:MAG: hypothetical protein C0597_04860 [Marinilabiliales bacterium]|nr:MAG: hypothetical protein C0597_04860 [Marinilabiliales bacterium]
MIKKALQLISLIFIIFFLKESAIHACTAFIIETNKQFILAKNLDWPIEDGLIIINKRCTAKTAFADSDNKISWISKYGSLTFNQFGKEFPLGGMNEKGLVIEELNNWGKVPKRKSFVLNEFQFVQYILDNYSSVDELKNIKDSLFIKPIFINLHYLISDKKGNKAIIEFYDNQMFYYENEHIDYPILSNNHYKNSLKYLRNFEGFGGDISIPKTNSSNERFVRCAQMLEKLKLRKHFSVVTEALEILNYVKQNDTQWSIVYDINNMTVFFKIKDGIQKEIDLLNFDFSCKDPVLCFRIDSLKDKRIDVSFEEYTGQKNMELLLHVFDKYTKFQLGEVEREVFVKLSEFGSNTQCVNK